MKLLESKGEAALVFAARMYLEKFGILKKAETDAFEASKYDTIHKAQNYLALLGKFYQALKEYVEAIREIFKAYENLYKVKKRVYGAGDELVKELEEDAKEAHEKYEEDLKKKNVKFQENVTKKATAKAFIDTLNDALSEVLNEKRSHAGGARHFRI